MPKRRGKPFLGWKRALQKAGIEYDDIEWELTETVPCQICGKERRDVISHAYRSHSVSPSEYREMYPDTALLSDITRSNRNQFDEQTVLPHWEPFWTPEYILDRLYAFYEAGLPMNNTSLAATDSGLVSAICSWKEEVGTWRNILDRLGIEQQEKVSSDVRAVDHVAEYQETKGGIRYPTAAKVKTAIRKRKREKLPLNIGSLREKEHSDYRTFLGSSSFLWELGQCIGSCRI